MEEQSALKRVPDEILSVIYHISSLLTEPSSTDRVLDSIIRSVTEGLGFYRASLYLLDREKGLLECKCISGFTHEQEFRARARPYDLKRHDCIEVKAVLTGNPILIKDAQKDPILTDIDRLVTKMFERGSILYVPLKVKGATIGILGVDKKKGEPGISEKEFESLSIFANYASIILENSKLYEALLNEKKFSEYVINSAIRGVLSVDIRGRIALINPAAELLLGVDKEQVLEKNLHEAIGWLHDIMNPTHMKMENIRGYEYVIKRGGKKAILSISSSPVLDDAGQIRGYLFSIEDITAERERGEYLQRMNRLIALGELAAGVAHEIRNPLTGIGVVLDLLKNKKQLNRTDFGLLEQATQEIERLEKLVSDLLEFARPKRFDFEPGDINEIVRSICFLISEQCNNQKIKLKALYGNRFPKLLMDSEKIRQGLLNIAINSIQAMPSGGELSIETSFLKKVKDARGSCILITIRDTGAGISNAVKDRIYDPFFTTYPEGTGLGLSITHSIIKEHQGTIGFDSEEGKGTCFTVLLPLAREERQIGKTLLGESNCE